MELSLVGPTNLLSARTFDPSRSVNWYLETIRNEGQKARVGFAPTSGLIPRYTFGDGPSVCLFYQDGRAFGINGTVFAELMADFTVVPYGTVTYDPSYRATICSNGSAGHQLLVTAGGSGSIFDLNANTFTAITDPDFPANVVMGEFFLGYFVVLALNSRQFWWSALEDGLSWDALDTAQRSWGSDNISFIKRMNTQLWIAGTQTSEVWYATGGVDVFAPIQGALLDFGAIADWSGVRHDNTIAWLSQDQRGGGQVVIAKGYTPDAISTYAIDRQIQLEAGSLRSTVGFAMQERGHTFLWMVPGFNNTTAETTPVFDSAEGAWHERALWDATAVTFRPHVAGTHMYAYETHFIGDRRTGVVYEMSPEFFSDRVAVV